MNRLRIIVMLALESMGSAGVGCRANRIWASVAPRDRFDDVTRIKYPKGKLTDEHQWVNVTAAHEHSQSQMSHQYLLVSLVSNGRGNGPPNFHSLDGGQQPKLLTRLRLRLGTTNPASARSKWAIILPLLIA
ncbi:hypothetical protein EVAR_29845_1 [Eumeta japonica]|uniref:Secreted protein n=1 Tax=Eumeta variegata TaxID=151549 RepID=A0A4C1VWN4_EUMVA|nr:hypothetical protein EVAR_29845_1 [Eumeta japonica]